MSNFWVSKFLPSPATTVAPVTKIPERVLFQTILSAIIEFSVALHLIPCWRLEPPVEPFTLLPLMII